MSKRNRERPTLDDLRLFTEICERGKDVRSLHQIAPKLGLLPSALSACLKRLEADCKQKLLNREERGGIGKPTSAGLALFAAATELLRKHAELRQDKPPKSIKVGTTDVCAQHLLPGSWLQDYLAAHPAVELSFELEQDPRNLLKKLRKGEIEFAIDGYLRHRDVKPFRTKNGKKNIEFTRVLVCNPNHPLAAQIEQGREHMAKNELKDWNIAMRVPDKHPTSDVIDPGKGRIISIDTYDGVLSFSMLNSSVAGIVPGFPWWLDPLRTQGVISYVPITGLKKSIPSLYLPSHTTMQDLDEDVRHLIKAIEHHLQSLSCVLGWPRPKG